MGASETARHYDRLDRFYRQLWGEHVHHGLWADPDWSPERAVRHLVERVAREARLTAGDRVVDIGCGYGAPARLWAEAYGVHVTGFTVSEAQAAFARRRAEGVDGPVPDIRLQDILDNSLPDASADAVVAVESLTHIDPPQSALQEAARLLRPGGRLVVLEFPPPPKGPFGWAFRLYFLRILPFLGGLVTGHPGAYGYLPQSTLAFPPPEALATRMEAAGFDAVTYRTLTFGVAALHVADVAPHPTEVPA